MAIPTSAIFLLRLLVYASLLSLKRGLAFEGRESAGSQHAQSTHHSVQITSLMPSSVCTASPKVGLGSPKKDLNFIFDTGSDLTRTQCEPCERYCYKQKDLIFDPSTSLSYSNISCNSPSCKKVHSVTGVSSGCSDSTCVYGIRYGDGSFSVGFFAKDKLTLTSNDVLTDFQFGCGQNNLGLYGGTAGLLGFGRNPLSLVSQTAQKYGKGFSYCLPSSCSSTGYLSFGKRGGGSKGVKYTPLLVNSDYPSFYFLDMVGITVGGSRLSIPKSVFSTAGTLIDSGTVITRLPPTAYSSVQKAFRDLMSDYPRVRGLSILETCYDLGEYDEVKVPKITLHFSGGADMELAAEGILIVVGASRVCLAFSLNRHDTDVAIIGNVQQRTLHVEYDDAEARVGFAPGGCD